MKLQINSLYLELVPRPEPEQINSLRNSMEEDGQQVAIICNSQGIILDGHTRFQVCKELGLEPKYVIKHFDSAQEEKEFVVSANLNRRQLTLFERGEVLFDWWKEEKKRSKSQGGHSMWHSRRTGRTFPTTTNGKKERLLQRFARIIGTSATVCHELTWLMLNAPEDVKAKLRKEEITVATAYKELAKPKRKTVAEYKKEGHVYLRYSICLNCQNPTIDAKKNDCHVHTVLCCKKCGWGN